MGSCTSVFDVTFLLISKCISAFNDKKSMMLELKSNKQEEESNLTELYLIDSNICIICRRHLQINTVHCIKCNICISDWDHHCFWLNICVSKQNKRQFRCFVILALICITLNVCLFGWVSISLILNQNFEQSSTELKIFAIIIFTSLFLVIIFNTIILMM